MQLDMSEFDPNPKAINRRRRLTEARLSGMIERAELALTLEDIKALIFHYPHKRFDAYAQQMFAIFSASGNPTDDDALLPVIECAWNYFFHRSLNGRSPAEVFADLV
jgi:hypothetical protein